MSDTPQSADTTDDLRAAIDRLAARLDRIEGQTTDPSPALDAKARLGAAWQSLRGASDDTGRGTANGLLWSALTICAVLVALILAVELVDEVFDGLWHLGRWID